SGPLSSACPPRWLCTSALRCSPRSTLFPYTTLFRSAVSTSGLACGCIVAMGLVLILCMSVSVVRWLPAVALLPGFTCSFNGWVRSEEHTSELQSREKLVCRLLLEKKNLPQCFMSNFF